MNTPIDVKDWINKTFENEKNSAVLKSVEGINILQKGGNFYGINSDPFIKVTLKKKVKFLKILFNGKSSNRSNRLKIYFANDGNFDEEHSIDLGQYYETKIEKTLNLKSAVNTIRIDLGDYDSKLDLEEIIIQEVPAALYYSSLGTKTKQLVQLITKENLRKAYYEIKYHGLRSTFEKINSKLDVQHNILEISLEEEIGDKIIVCIHDLEQAGAQMLTLLIVKSLIEDFGLKVIVITLKGGKLLNQFEKVTKVINLNQNMVTHILKRKEFEECIENLKKKGYLMAICNSSATGALAEVLHEKGIKCIGLIHELPTTLQDYGLVDTAKKQWNCSETLIFANQFVKNEFLKMYNNGLDCEKTRIIPQAINKPSKIEKNEAYRTLVQRHGLPEGTKIVLGTGVGGLRKGIDAFMEVGRMCLKLSDVPMVFIWTGTLDREIKEWVLHDIKKLRQEKNFIILDFVQDMGTYEAAASVFLMTSREDPFPSAVLETMYLGTPVISFDETGGIPELLAEERGIVVDYLDLKAMASEVIKLLNNVKYCEKIAITGQNYVTSHFDKKDYVEKLLKCLGYNAVNKKQVEKAYQACIKYPIQDKRKKVLHFIDNFSTGGSSKLVVDIYEWLGHKYEQVIIANYYPEKIEYEGVPVIKMEESISDSKILDYINDFKPDIIHVHYWESRWYTKIINLLENVKGCKIIENVNIPTFPYTKDYIDKYVYVSQYTLKEYGADEKKDIFIYPGSDFSLFTRPLKDGYLPKDTIGMVYRLDIDKLTDFSIDFFIRVVEKRPNTKAIIVGGGPRYDQYYAKVKKANVLNNFVFTGFVPYDQLLDYYKKFTIFVAPVWRESFGQVSPFAMSMGIPVVGYDIGALYEITNNHDLLAKFEDIEMLSDKIVQLLDDYNMCQDIGKYNQMRAEQLFGLKSMIKSYDELYCELLEE